MPKGKETTHVAMLDGEQELLEGSPLLNKNPYTDISNTPLKWHKFLCWFLFPLIIVVNTVKFVRFLVELVNIISAISAGQVPLKIYLMMALMAVCITLIVILVVGLLRFKRYGYILIFITAGLITFNNVIDNILSMSTENIIGIVAPLIIWTLIIIYYYKRRRLFGFH